MGTVEPGPEDELNGDLSETEERLAAWRPVSAPADRDRMLFEAGRAAGRADARGRAGLALAACLALVSAGLGARLEQERPRRLALETQVVQRTRGNPAPAVAPVSEPAAVLAPDSYLVLTHRWHAAGLDEAPTPRSNTPPDEPAAGPEPTLRAHGERGILNF